VVQAWSKLAEKKKKERGRRGKKKKEIKTNQEKKRPLVDLLRARSDTRAAAQITCMIEKRISTALGWTRGKKIRIPKNGIGIGNGRR